MIRHRFLGILAIGFLVSFAGCQPTTKVSSTESSRADSSGTAATETKPAADAGAVNESLQGTVKIDGSSTVEPISTFIAESFSKKYPNVSVTVGRSGTSGGFKAFVRDELDFSAASRPITKDEQEAAAKSGIEFVELAIAYDGLTLVVPKSSEWLDQLTVDEIKKIFVAPGAKTWKEVRDTWPATEIKIYAPGTDSGTFDYFKEVVAGKTGSLRSDMSTSEDDNVLVTGVAKSADSIGFFGVAYYDANKDKLRAVPIVNPQTGTAELPTAAKIESGDYAPFSRPLFVYAKTGALKRPEVKAFAKYYLSQVSEAAKKVGYVALPEAIQAVTAKHLEDRATGTRFLDSEGNKKSGPLSEVYVLPESK